MSVFEALVRAGLAVCHSSVALQQCSRHFSTSICTRIRMHSIPEPKVVDRWTEKRSMFGVYDNIGILGDFKVHPKSIVKAPVWLKGFSGNELERLIRKKKMVGDRMMMDDRHSLDKRIRYLYRRFNRYGKHR
ncbi:large ribosomal subunit protein mL51 [Sardina pilchardus]|uniref:large ribosomal subunit protein mL51 n=1 Tax=Sardina pilchardus TaxID=27697 RepID=UPI002E11D0A3